MRNRIQRGARMTARESVHGTTLEAPKDSAARHPWMTRARWNARLGQWLATVEPGFVNEATPFYRALVQEQQAIDPSWGANPLSGLPYFSSAIFSKEKPSDAVRRVDVPLYLRPAMPMTFRALGFDGSPQYPVPAFFLKMGVVATPRPPTAEEAADGAELVDTVKPKNLRLLRACDFILHQPRSALTSTITLEAGPATGFSNVKQTLSTRTQTAGDVLQIFTGVASDRTAQPINPLAGDYEEQTFDEILVSTVFLLSPPNAPLGSVPNETWTPYVRHNLFWNVLYEQPAFQPIPGDPGTPYIPPLAAGAAQIVINYLTASINDATDQALNILLGHSMAGRFWTPTGGGHEAQIQALAAAPESAGLNKAERLRLAAVAAARAEREERLDPPFPYRAEPFDFSIVRAA